MVLFNYVFFMKSKLRDRLTNSFSFGYQNVCSRSLFHEYFSIWRCNQGLARSKYRGIWLMFRFFYIFSCCTPTLSVVAHCFELKLKLVYKQVDKQCHQMFCDCLYIYMKVAFFPISLMCVLCDLDFRFIQTCL